MPTCAFHVVIHFLLFFWLFSDIILAVRHFVNDGFKGDFE